MSGFDKLVRELNVSHTEFDIEKLLIIIAFIDHHFKN